MKPSGPFGSLSRGASVSSALRSAPAQNASSPAPVRTRTRASSSATKRAVGLAELLGGRAVDGVAPLGPVDGEDGGGAGALVANELGLPAARPLGRAGAGLRGLLATVLALVERVLEHRQRKMSSGNAAMRMKPAFVTILSFVRPYQPSPPS